jgi:hypothetical protein
VAPGPAIPDRQKNYLGSIRHEKTNALFLGNRVIGRIIVVGEIIGGVAIVYLPMVRGFAALPTTTKKKHEGWPPIGDRVIPYAYANHVVV